MTDPVEGRMSAAEEIVRLAAPRVWEPEEIECVHTPLLRKLECLQCVAAILAQQPTQDAREADPVEGRVSVEEAAREWVNTPHSGRKRAIETLTALLTTREAAKDERIGIEMARADRFERELAEAKREAAIQKHDSEVENQEKMIELSDELDESNKDRDTNWAAFQRARKDSARLRGAASELIEVADLRGDTELPHPSAEPDKLWTARMQTAWDDLRAAIDSAREKP